MNKDIKIKYRPKSFKTFLGNCDLKDILKGMIEAEDLPHTIMLTGPRGCGKTSLGRVIPQEMGCSLNDLKELDSAIFNGIKTVRSIREELVYPPKDGEIKFYLIDEVHMLGQGGSSEKNKSQNALLKSIEEPPEYVYWILCTTNPEMVMKTVRSRCTEFQVRPLEIKDTIKLVKRVSKGEKKPIEKLVSKKLHEITQGFPRDTLTLLAKIINLSSTKKQLRILKTENLVENKAIIDLCRCLMKGGKKGSNWNSARKILNGLKGEQPETIRQAIMRYANSVLLNGNPEGALILGWFVYKPTYDMGFPLITQFCFNICERIEPPC